MGFDRCLCREIVWIDSQVCLQFQIGYRHCWSCGIREFIFQYLLIIILPCKLLQCSTSHCGFETNDQVNGWILELCNMMGSLKAYGLATAHQLYHRQVLHHPLLERILTSHLQTFGCTVLMGTSLEEINSVSS